MQRRDASCSPNTVVYRLRTLFAFSDITIDLASPENGLAGPTARSIKTAWGGDAQAACRDSAGASSIQSNSGVGRFISHSRRRDHRRAS